MAAGILVSSTAMATDDQSITQSPASFRLLDLPQELQDHVYTFYHKSKHTYPRVKVDVTGRNSRFESHKFLLMIGNQKSLALEIACKKLCADSRRIRDKTWSRTLYCNEVLEWCDDIPLLPNRPGNAWVRSYVNRLKLDFEDLPLCSVGVFKTLIGSFENLRYFKIIDSVGYGKIMELHPSNIGAIRQLSRSMLEAQLLEETTRARMLPNISLLQDRYGTNFKVEYTHRVPLFVCHYCHPYYWDNFWKDSYVSRHQAHVTGSNTANGNRTSRTHSVWNTRFLR